MPTIYPWVSVQIPSFAMDRQFDHEKLKVYQRELEFVSWATDIIVAAKEKSGDVRVGEVIGQLDRASLSALLNTAEGNGKRRRPVRVKYFDDARGSATECAACLDAMVAKKVLSKQDVEAGKEMLLDIVSMLSGLIGFFEGDSQLGEEEAEENEEED